MRDTRTPSPIRLRWHRPLNLINARLILTGLRHPDTTPTNGLHYTGAQITIVTRAGTHTLQPRLGDTIPTPETTWRLHTILCPTNTDPIADLIPIHPTQTQRPPS